MEACEDYKVTEKFIKFAQNILREFQLDFCQIFCTFNQTLKTCLNYAFSITSKAADCLLLALLLIPATNFGRW